MKKIIVAILKVLLAIVSYAIGGGIIVFLASVLFHNNIPPTMNIVVSGISAIVGGGGMIWLLRRLIDKKSIVSMGYQWKDAISGKSWGRDIIWGSVLGTVMIVTGTAFLLFIGSIEVVGTSFDWTTTLALFFMFICVAVGEETCFRGYSLSNLMEVMNKYAALALSAVLFSVPHLLNPNTSLMSFIGILLAGLMLGAAYLYTRNLWFPIGIHLFWNFVQSMAGFNVSGLDTPTYFILKYPEQTIINGGEFGFESSLVCAIILILSIAGTLFYYNRKASKNA